MIVVDTSVWVSVLRSRRSPETAAFAALIDSDHVLLAAPVRTELTGGTNAVTRARLTRLLTALPIVYPTDDTWRLMDRWSAVAADRGQRFGMGDLLIAALASEAGALVWSLDTDFERLATLRLVSLYHPA
jgi:predicted nucleic acid-binding protein